MDLPPPPPVLASAALNASASQFAPRREFIRDQHTYSTFALLALSGTSLVRLYSFPPPVLAALRQFFAAHKLLAHTREDAAQALCEFTLESRPWAIAKNVRTEKLLVDILAVVFRHGFLFLSTIDYGREQDDRLALAFSRPAVGGAGSRAGSPLPGAAAGAGGALGAPARAPRIPFAISFSSATVMRVISPPLHSTPAILQAVRNSWPRGVVAEKKVAETCYEFKLKGYRWFQEDTFATDSLRHILTLLASLDAHGFKLLSSLTLTNRSRIKDLWMFTGPSREGATPDSPSASPNTSSVELRSQLTPDGSGGSASSGTGMGTGTGTRHVRSVTVPSALLASPRMDGHAPSTSHGRSPTEGAIHPPSPLSASLSQNASARSVLRKTSPKTAALAAAASSASADGAARGMPGAVHEPIRTSLPSEVGSAINMTGVGTLRVHGGHTETFTPSPYRESDVIYETGGESSDDISPGSYNTSNEQDPMKRALPTPPATKAPVPKHADSGRGTYGVHNHRASEIDQPRTPSPPASTLLSPGVFRDTTFTSSTGWRSTEIPIAWTGPGQDPSHQESKYDGRDSGVGMGHADRPSINSKAFTSHSSFGPRFPGGWRLTPVEEKRDSDLVTSQVGLAAASLDRVQETAERNGADGGWGPLEPPPERQELNARVHSPELAHYSRPVRKSEAGIVGVIPDAAGGTSSSAMAAATAGARPLPDPKQTPAGEPRPGTEGWVLVNVEGTASGAGPVSPHNMASGSGSRTGHGQPMRPPNRARSTSDSGLHRLAGTTSPSSSSPSPFGGASFSSSHVQAGPQGRGPGLPPGQGNGPSGAMSAAAKAIVIIDAVEARRGDTPASEAGKGPGAGARADGGLRRFFSLNKSESAEGPGAGTPSRLSRRGSRGQQQQQQQLGVAAPDEQRSHSGVGLSGRFKKKNTSQPTMPGEFARERVSTDSW